MKSNWTPQHNATRKKIDALNKRKQDLDKEFERIKLSFRIKKQNINKVIKEVQNECNHIEGCSFLIFSCEVCGYMDDL